jgi:hypothetical protein
VHSTARRGETYVRFIVTTKRVRRFAHADVHAARLLSQCHCVTLESANRDCARDSESGRVPNSVIGGYSVDAVTERATARERLVCAFPKHDALHTSDAPVDAESYECID